VRPDRLRVDAVGVCAWCVLIGAAVGEAFGRDGSVVRSWSLTSPRADSSGPVPVRSSDSRCGLR
jgi:hypothetical protein